MVTPLTQNFFLLKILLGTNSSRSTLTWFTFSIDALIPLCFETITPHTQHGCHVMEHLKPTGEELRHAEAITVLVVKQVSFFSKAKVLNLE